MELFTLKSVLRLTGLNPDTVRAWEKRYQAVKPGRTNTGRRMYSESEVNRLKLLAELTFNGHSISTIANLTDDELISLLASIKSSNPLSKSSAINPQVKNTSDSLLKAIDAFDLKKLEIQLAKATYSMSSRDLLFYLIPQLMYQVGAKVEDGTMDISQEHALSELIKKTIRKIFDDLEPINGLMKPEKTLLFATPEGHLHEFALLMSAVVCRYNGFNTHYLGTNLPAESLLNACKKLNPHAVVISFSRLIDAESKENSNAFLNEIGKQLPASTLIWIGGNIPKIKAINFKQEIWSLENLEALETKIKNFYLK